MTSAELKAFIPEGHEIVMMLDAKDGCRVFTSSKRDGNGWEHEILIPTVRLARRDEYAPEFAPIRPRSFQAA